MEMNVKMGTYTYNNETYNFNFYTNLSAAMKVEFVDSVVSLLVEENHYNSVIHNLVFDFFIIDVFTDVDTTNFRNSKTFLDDVEQFLEETNIVEIVRVNVPHVLFDELNNAVNKSVQYLTGIQFNPLNEALASLMKTLEQKINEIDLDSIIGMVQKFAGMTEDFTLENLVNTYMNSDVHKKNLTEIENSKKNMIKVAEDLDKVIKLVNDKQ
jgi:hypothetical protein